MLIDGGLGPAQMSAAMKVADPDHLIGIRRALAAARTLRWPGRRIAVEPTNRVARRLLGVEHDLPSLQDAPSVTLPVVDPDAEAAVVFTSGATGPSKGVRYSAARIDAQIRTLVEQYDISADDSLVAAFAPFALYGPAMGLPSTVPDMDVSSLAPSRQRPSSTPSRRSMPRSCSPRRGDPERARNARRTR